MNPFKVRKIINGAHRNGERLIVEELNKRCGVRLRHAHLIMSKDMFECESCGGFPRHWVKRVSLFGWVTLWKYTPPKETDFSQIKKENDLKSLEEIKTLREIKEQKDNS